MICHSLVPQPPPCACPLRNVFPPGDVERKLTCLQESGNQGDHENLRAVYERMLKRWPERFQVKPLGVLDLEPLADVLDHLALMPPCEMLRALMTGFGNARQDRRSTVEVVDLPKAAAARSSIGFVQ